MPHLRTDLESVTAEGHGTAVAAIAVLAWLMALTATVSVALKTMSVIVWGASALVALLPALTLMVLAHTPAHTPAKTVAEIIRDAEARS